MKNPFKEFGPTSWSIDNKTSIYILTIIITFAGIWTYFKLPKEQFPDIVIPTIYVSTGYPGTSPTDMENLVTKELEKQIKSVNGVKKFTSNSVQDYSAVVVEFNADVEVNIAKQRVKDAVDKAKPNLPQDLPAEPAVQEINFSDIPIMFVNISGDYENGKLKRFAKMAKDKIEAMKEISRVDMAGALERELKIDVDMYKMQAAQLTMSDIEGAVYRENLTMSGGLIKVGEMKRSVRIEGEFKDPNAIGNIVVKTMRGAPIYIKDVADVVYGFEEKESYARLNHKSVITLNIVKKAGENLIEASDKVRAIMQELHDTKYPPGLTYTITGDMSAKTRVTLADLINSIVIGFILVTLVLMFFMGTTNALFVALSVPLSMLLAFMVMPTIDFSMNMIVLFAFLFALGIVVDDAIVVIENTHRIYHDEHIPIVTAAKKAAGEIFVPVLSGTLTTLAPFIPLAFLPGIVGKFMFYLPITLIITLIASLVVAFIINPVFAVSFMSKEEREKDPRNGFVKNNRGLVIASVIFLMVALICYATKSIGMGNLAVFLTAMLWVNRLLFEKIIKKFQENVWPRFMDFYEKLIKGAIKHSGKMILGTIALFFISIILTGIMGASGALKVVFFPKGDPNFVYVYISMPIGTDQAVTDSITKKVEDKVFKVVGENNPVVESIISNVAIGAGENAPGGGKNAESNKGKVSVAFVEYAKRNGVSTREYLDKIREEVKGMPGVQITVDQERNGPPTGKPINIEVSGEEFDDLVTISNNFIRYIDSLQIGGIEELKSDLVDKKPEIVVEIDRERANREGLSTLIIAGEVRSAIFGKEVSKFRDGEDQYKIMLRYEMDQRNKMDDLLNMKITYRDMAMGGAIRQIPLSSVATVKYSNTYGGITRKNQKRVVTISSNVLTGYTANEIVSKIKNAIPNFKMKDGYEIKLTGEQEDQNETSSFLGIALLMSLGMIFMILVTQFNSVSKSVIILTEIAFSIIGVLLGYIFFRMEFVILMTGIGIVGLAGIVVKNGILLVEFTDELRGRGYKLKPALVAAGKIRATPVILTAAAAILGLIPMAVGFNIDFVSLFQHFQPHIHFGGDNVAFWGPLSWTIIFGLSFATFLTLLLVPAMYYRVHLFKIWIRKRLNRMNFKRGVAPKAGAEPKYVLNEN
jgi:multidrug efflux pump